MNCEDMVNMPELTGVLNLKAGEEGMMHPIRWIYFADCLQCIKNEYRVEDYIHGSEEVLKLGEKPSSIGILLPPIAKDSFFETINGRGPLPRKSFSMGEADEKRFYLECRRLFS